MNAANDGGWQGARRGGWQGGANSGGGMQQNAWGGQAMGAMGVAMGAMGDMGRGGSGTGSWQQPDYGMQHPAHFGGREQPMEFGRSGGGGSGGGMGGGMGGSARYPHHPPSRGPNMHGADLAGHGWSGGGTNFNIRGFDGGSTGGFPGPGGGGNGPGGHLSGLGGPGGGGGGGGRYPGGFDGPGGGGGAGWQRHASQTQRGPDAMMMGRMDSNAPFDDRRGHQGHGSAYDPVAGAPAGGGGSGFGFSGGGRNDGFASSGGYYGGGRDHPDTVVSGTAIDDESSAARIARDELAVRSSLQGVAVSRRLAGTRRPREMFVIQTILAPLRQNLLSYPISGALIGLLWMWWHAHSINLTFCLPVLQPID